MSNSLSRSSYLEQDTVNTFPTGAAGGSVAQDFLIRGGILVLCTGAAEQRNRRALTAHEVRRIIMKRSYSLMLAAVMSLASATMYAQTASIAGKWSGELPAAQGRGSAQPITVELKLEADALTGSVTEGALGSRPITNAAVEGGTFS